MGNNEKNEGSQAGFSSAVRRLPAFKSLLILRDVGKILVRFGSQETLEDAQKEMINKYRTERAIGVISLSGRPQLLNWFRAIYLIDPGIIAEIESLLDELFNKGIEMGARQEKLLSSQPPPVPRSVR
jgi:hypothetical protein